MSKIVVLMGAPGAGKGSQARLLEERLHLPQISTGEIFRAIAQTQTQLAAEVRAIQQSGKLIPDDLVIRVVQDRTGREDCRNGFVLDGFPRTTVQAEMLERLALQQGNKLVTIFVNVPFDILEKRLTGRRNCPVGGETYNIYFQPPTNDNVCDNHAGAQLEQRSDDKPDKVRVRLETYEQQTRPVLDYYEQTGRLHRVGGAGKPEAIYENIASIVSE